ncbi:hypothetical protein K5I04_04370 [Murdochiella sp. Marseille-P8839]|nr:hypothetical protein [Murdochiella sp. Marseille-P8839]
MALKEEISILKSHGLSRKDAPRLKSAFMYRFAYSPMRERVRFHRMKFFIHVFPGTGILSIFFFWSHINRISIIDIFVGGDADGETEINHDIIKKQEYPHRESTCLQEG